MNAAISPEHQASMERATRQAEVVAALQQVVPQHALLWTPEDTTPYE
jgi:glycolate oxidase